ncbi:hypothetical protein PV325_003290, partial [Microctonus aethiopoides]
MTDGHRKSYIMRNKWGRFALNVNLWDESNAPIVKVRDLSSIELNERERSGILSDRMIGASLNYLMTSPEIGSYVLTKCDLRKLNLMDINALKNYRYIQYLDLTHNKLTNLFSLNALSYLLYLKASHNHLMDILNFNPPWYLTYVNLSRNNIKFMNDLQEFWSIIRLDLSHNDIEAISGLQKLKYLRYLNLSYNLIECVQNLDYLNIQELNLEYNCIRRFISAEPGYGIETLSNLRTLIIGHNRLSSLEFFRNIYCLRLIDLKYNKISDLMEISHLKSLVYEIDLRGNPCTKWPNYKDVVLYSMPSVVFLDGAQVTIAEKVSAATTFDPSIELLASRGLTKLILLEQLNAPKIDESIIPYDEVSPPLVILTGPTAVKKTILGLHIAETLFKKVKYCRSHTTREFSINNIETKAYYVVEREEFNEMIRNGEFLTIEELIGNNYGFHSQEIADLKLENKIGIAQMDLQATIQMKSRYPNTKLILVLAKDEEIHRQWIKDKFKIFTWIKDSVENLWALTIGKRQSEHLIETMESKMNFINDIIDDIIDTLNLPSYSINVRPQSTGATTTDIILQSRTMLPKLTKTRQQLFEEKKHIKFKSASSIKELRRIYSSDIDENFSDLKVILDEQMNIIVDDDETKLKRRRAKMLRQRQAHRDVDNLILTEDTESIFSDESLDCSLQGFKESDVDPKILMNMYIEVILKSRQMYLDQHLNNPGFYSLVVYSDEFKNATNLLKTFIRDLYVNYPLKKPRNIPEVDYLNRSIIPNKIDEITATTLHYRHNSSKHLYRRR